MDSNRLIETATRRLATKHVVADRAFDLPSLRALVCESGSGHLAHGHDGALARLAGAVLDAAIADAVAEVIADPDRMGPAQSYFFSSDCAFWAELISVDPDNLTDNLCDLCDALADAVRADPSRVVPITTNLDKLKIEYEGEYEQLPLIGFTEAAFEAAAHLLDRPIKKFRQTSRAVQLVQLSLFSSAA